MLYSASHHCINGIFIYLSIELAIIFRSTENESDRIARSINGEVISESDNAEDIVTVSEPLSAEGKTSTQKKRRAIQRTKKTKNRKGYSREKISVDMNQKEPVI